MKTLILYASKHGTTQKVVNALKTKLIGEVVTQNVHDHTHLDVSTFDKVIIGGPIYNGSLESSLKIMVEAHQAEILQKKVGLFICCMYDEETSAEQFNRAFSDELLACAEADGYFGFELKLNKLNIFEKTLVKAVANDRLDDSGIDQDEITRFAEKMNQIG